jgi:chromosome segregation ATPase
MPSQQRKLIGLEEDREVAAQEYEKLKDQKENLERKLDAMPKMQDDIKKLLSKDRKLSGRMLSLQSSHGENLSRKEKLEAKVKAISSKLGRIEEEIRVTRSTKELLLGIRPSQFDVDVFEETQSDVDKNVENFVGEMKEQIDNLKIELSSLHTQLDEKKAEKNALISKKREFLEIIERLRNQMGEDINKEILLSELESLNRQQDRLSLAIDEKQKIILQDKEAIASVTFRIKQEEKYHREMLKRHSYLISRRQEMNNINKVGEEIQRLKDETQKLKMDSEVNRVMHKTINKLTEDMDPTKRQLLSALESCERIFGEFEREIDSLLSA